MGDGVEVEEVDEGDGVTVVDDELEDAAGVLDGAMLDVVEDAVEVGEGADVGEIGASVEDAVGELDVDVGDGSAAARPMPDTDSAAVAAITDIRMVVCFMNSPVMSWPTATPPPPFILDAWRRVRLHRFGAASSPRAPSPTPSRCGVRTPTDPFVLRPLQPCQPVVTTQLRRRDARWRAPRSSGRRTPSRAIRRRR